MWFKVDSGFLRHPKTCAAAAAVGGPRKRALGRVAAVWLELGTYSATYLSDGFIPDAELDELRTDPAGRQVVDALIAAGMAHAEVGGVRLHDWADYQPSAAEYKDKRKRDRDRKREARSTGAASAKRPRGQTTDVLAESAGNPARSRARDPVPSRSEDPKEPRAERRAVPARMELAAVRLHLMAATHSLIETGRFEGPHGTLREGELVEELKCIAARDLKVEDYTEIRSIVNAVVGTRQSRAVS